jgi:hypothetical protein
MAKHWTGLDEVTCHACGGQGCERCSGTGLIPVEQLTPEEERKHFDGPSDNEAAE